MSFRDHEEFLSIQAINDSSDLKEQAEWEELGLEVVD